MTRRKFAGRWRYVWRAGHRVIAVSNPRRCAARQHPAGFRPGVCGPAAGPDSGHGADPRLRAACPWLKIVVITAYATIETAVEAMRRGAFDYLPKPFTPDQVLCWSQKVAELLARWSKGRGGQEELERVEPGDGVPIHHPGVQRAVTLPGRWRPPRRRSLLRGESGTGKRRVGAGHPRMEAAGGQALRHRSCPSLSPELLESELFGHVRGAFTGPCGITPAGWPPATGGTLFLDEIGDLPLGIQPKLLRLLQERLYERVGETETRRADVRIIAATNVDLEKAVGEGRFREDLFYRLNVIQIEIPPLRERGEDIVALAGRLLTFFARQNHHRFLGFTAGDREALASYNRPGNIRELSNVIERAVMLCT